MNHQEVKHKGRACQVRIGCGHLAVMSRCPLPLYSSSNGTSEDSDQSDETDVDIRCKIHLQPDSPELPLTAGAPRKCCLTSARQFYFYSLLEVFTVTKESQMTLSIVLLFQPWREWWETGWQEHVFSSKISWESLPPLGGLKLSDYAKPWEMSLTHENVNKGSFDHAAEVTFTPRSFF